MLPTTPARATLLISFTGAMMASLPALARDSLWVTANVPTVDVTPRSQGRNFIRLPALEYTFEIRARCVDGRRPAAVSLSVADSRRTLGADKLSDDDPAQISLRIPPAQIAPLPVEGFCVSATQNGEYSSLDADTELTIPSALSAQASLLCESVEDKAITYVSQGLDVMLSCQVTPQEDAEQRMPADAAIEEIILR